MADHCYAVFFMLTVINPVTYKPLMLSVVMLSVVAPKLSLLTF